jgi:hypothetical protein
MEELNYRKIKNYLRKQLSKYNENLIRSKLLCLFYSNINNIPLAKKIDNDEYKTIINDFPYYFKDIDREKIIEIFNKDVSSKKPLDVNYDIYIKFYNYDINENNYLEISKNTFRPIYEENWKEKTEKINNIEFKYQHSFYADYLRYYIKNKKFPDLIEFISYIYNKYKKPIHKDILNVFKNIEKSYNPIKKYIEENNLDYEYIKDCINKSASIIKRIEIQNK